MQIAEAQADLRRAYVGGGPGAIISSFVWFAAAIAEPMHGTAAAFKLLFFGGMLIFPVGLLVEKLIFKAPKPADGNPLGMIALESTIAMIACLLAAWLLLPDRPELVFPVAAIAVGTHYFAFASAYGDRTYWTMAAIITLAGSAAIFKFVAIPGGLIAAIGVIELLFGLYLTIQAKKEAA